MAELQKASIVRLASGSYIGQHMAELQKASIVRFASGSYRPAHGRTAEGKYCKVC